MADLHQARSIHFYPHRQFCSYGGFFFFFFFESEFLFRGAYNGVQRRSRAVRLGV